MYFVDLRTDHENPLSSLVLQNPAHGILCRTKGNQAENESQPGERGNILDNVTEKASLYLGELKEVDPLPL